MKVLILSCLLFIGCTTMQVNAPGGYSASYTRWGTQHIQGFAFERDELGLIRIGFAKQESDAKILDAVKLLLGAQQ